MFWSRLLRVPWTARRSNQSILKIISPGCSLEGLILKLKFQYFGHLMQRSNSLERILMLGKIQDRRRMGWQRMRCLDGTLTHWTRVCTNSGRWWRTGKPGVLQSLGWQRVGHNWVTEKHQLPCGRLNGVHFCDFRENISNPKWQSTTGNNNQSKWAL